MISPQTSTPLIKQGSVRAIIFMLAFLGCAVLAGFVTNILIQAPGTAPAKGGPAGYAAILSLFIIEITGILLTVIFRRFIDRRPLVTLGFQWQQYEHDGYTGFCLGPALLGTGTLLLFATKNLEWSDASFQPSDIFIAVVLMMMIALSEEMVFRGYILNNLMESVNKWAALGISAALFAVAHGSNPGITSVAAVNLWLGGLLLGINYIYTRNLWFGMLFHFSWNFFQGPVLGYEVSGMPLQSILQPDITGPWWLTGHPFGFEGSFIATCLFMLALLTLYTVYEKKYPNAKR
jgi:membrane protease YdiL (CAAX protease family)